MDGDRVEIELPLTMRLEAIDSERAHVVALVRGPLVLFPMTENAPAVTREQLLSAARLPGEPAWQAQTASDRLRLLPFSAIGDERYMTYMALSS